MCQFTHNRMEWLISTLTTGGYNTGGSDVCGKGGGSKYNF